MPRPPQEALPRLLRRVDERLEGELPPAEAKRLLMAALVLTGMRVGRSNLKLLKENLAMVDLRDSSTYWVILEEGMAKGKEEGKAEGLRAMLLEVGARRLGRPAADVQSRLSAIDDAERLHRMGQRVLDVATWQELLATA